MQNEDAELTSAKKESSASAEMVNLQLDNAILQFDFIITKLTQTDGVDCYAGADAQPALDREFTSSMSAIQSMLDGWSSLPQGRSEERNARKDTEMHGLDDLDDAIVIADGDRCRLLDSPTTSDSDDDAAFADGYGTFKI